MTLSQSESANFSPQEESRGDLAFILSLIGGVIMTVGWVIAVSIAYAGRSLFYGVTGVGSWMVGVPSFPYMMNGYTGNTFQVTAWLALLGLGAGILVLVLALLLRSIRPADRKIWGVLILISSVIGLAGIGGLFVGSLLGFMGGLLAATDG